MQTYWTYITTRNEAEAKKVGRGLIEDQLAACVNIIDGMQSMFWWKGNIESDDETVVIAKTKDSLIDDVVAKVKELHSDDVPCVISLPIEKGNPEFIEWIQEETK